MMKKEQILLRMEQQQESLFSFSISSFVSWYQEKLKFFISYQTKNEKKKFFLLFFQANRRLHVASLHLFFFFFCAFYRFFPFLISVFLFFDFFRGKSVEIVGNLLKFGHFNCAIQSKKILVVFRHSFCLLSRHL